MSGNRKDQATVTLGALTKTVAAVALVQASLDTIEPYDASRVYTPKEREPYDALSDRFVRAVEVAIKFFRSYELLMYAESSDTYRDLLGRMEKLEIAASVSLWVGMREIRNRIVHDYLPEKIKHLYDEITGVFGKELIRLAGQADELRRSINETTSD